MQIFFEPALLVNLDHVSRIEFGEDSSGPVAIIQFNELGYVTQGQSQSPLNPNPAASGADGHLDSLQMRITGADAEALREAVRAHADTVIGESDPEPEPAN